MTHVSLPSIPEQLSCFLANLRRCKNLSWIKSRAETNIANACVLIKDFSTPMVKVVLKYLLDHLIQYLSRHMVYRLEALCLLGVFIGYFNASLQGLNFYPTETIH